MGRKHKSNNDNTFGYSYNFSIAKPFDTREVVNTYDDLINSDTWKQGGVYVHYKGMKVSCADSGAIYVYKGENESVTDVQNTENWVAQGTGGSGGSDIDLSDYYTKTQTNNLLNEKLNKSDIADWAKESNRPTYTYTDIEGLEGVLNNKVETDSLSNVAKTGDYKDLQNTPDIYDKSEVDLFISNIKSPEYIIESVNNSNYAASYQLKKDGVSIGDVINIPKDMVVSSGEVRKLNAEEITAGKGDEDSLYIVLTISNSTNDKLYIPVNQLFDDYTGSDYIEVAGNGTISLKTNDLTTYFDGKYDELGAAKAVQDNLDNYISTNNAAFENYLKTNDVDTKVAELGYAKTEDVNTAITNAINEAINDVLDKEY